MDICEQKNIQMHRHGKRFKFEAFDKLHLKSKTTILKLIPVLCEIN